MSIWAIGDVHGQAAMLEELLGALPRTPNDTTVFLGDYLDLGPDSKRVVEIALEQQGAILLWGNHEDMAAFSLGEPYPSRIGYDPVDWYRNGGWETCESYDLKPEDALPTTCPEALKTLFSRLQTFWQDPQTGIYFVHAGIPPGKSPENCDAETLLWDRESLGRLDKSGRFYVCGHTPQREGRPWVLPDKICLDTAAAYGGPLSALQLPERNLYQSFPDGHVVGPIPM